MRDGTSNCQSVSDKAVWHLKGKSFYQRQKRFIENLATRDPFGLR